MITAKHAPCACRPCHYWRCVISGCRRPTIPSSTLQQGTLHAINGEQILEPTCLKTAAEDLLESRDVVKVHERVVLSGDVGIRGLATAESCPWLELVVQPVLFGATERVGVKDVERR